MDPHHDRWIFITTPFRNDHVDQEIPVPIDNRCCLRAVRNSAVLRTDGMTRWKAPRHHETVAVRSLNLRIGDAHTYSLPRRVRETVDLASSKKHQPSNEPLCGPALEAQRSSYRWGRI